MENEKLKEKVEIGQMNIKKEKEKKETMNE